jgi:pimeloyl-ACP methyl ester carboxylesterase
VRWIVVLFAALPLLLLLIAAAAPNESGRNLLRAARHVVAVELLLVMVLAVIGATYENRSRFRDKVLYKPPGQLIDLGGYRLHLYCTGQGSPTVILDFGLDGSYLDWFRVQPELARFTRVCSYDRAGYGWSDPSPRRRIPSEMVEELGKALELAGEKPPYVVVGHSFGGFDALMFAHKNASEVAGVVLVDSTHPDQRVNFGWRKRIWLRTMQLTMPFGLPRWRQWCGTGPAEIRGTKTELECRSKVWATNYAQQAAFDESAAEVRKLAALGEMPLAVISRDPKRPVANADSEERWQKMQVDLLRLSTRSRQVIAEGSDHSVPINRPDVVVSAIAEMISKRG